MKILRCRTGRLIVTLLATAILVWVQASLGAESNASLGVGPSAFLDAGNFRVESSDCGSSHWGFAGQCLSAPQGPSTPQETLGAPRGFFDEQESIAELTGSSRAYLLGARSSRPVYRCIETVSTCLANFRLALLGLPSTHQTRSAGQGRLDRLGVGDRSP